MPKRVRKPRIVIEVSQRRKSWYEQAAANLDLSVAEWARRILDAAAEDVLKEERDSG